MNTALKVPLFLTLLVSVCCFPASVFAQSDQAKIQVSCFSKDGKKLMGEEISFHSEKSGKVTLGITDENGQFNCQLKGPDQYLIKVKSLTGLTDYTRFILPTLAANHQYGTYEISVEIEPGYEFTLDNVYFETASAKLKEKSFAELDELVEFMQRKQTAVIEIQGHTDSEGSEEDNQVLSENRASSVRTYLLNKGIAPERVKSKGFGESQPIADNSTEQGRALNRRTTVLVLKQ